MSIPFRTRRPRFLVTLDGRATGYVHAESVWHVLADLCRPDNPQTFCGGLHPDGSLRLTAIWEEGDIRSCEVEISPETHLAGDGMPAEAQLAVTS